MLKWHRILCVSALLGSPLMVTAQSQSVAAVRVGLPILVDAEQAAPKPAPSAQPATTTPKANPNQSRQVSLQVERHRLSNGLRVVLNPDHTIPTVAIAVYYDVGSRNEERGRSGFAHLFEHMMFQGSANIAKGEHFQLVMNRGGSVNGTTSEDRTNYFETLPSNELALGLWLEADRMRSLAVTQENFENQRQTVMEERRQSYDNRPYMQSMLRINELAFGDYFPYAHSTIGDMQDLQAAPLSAVKEFFDTYYAPNNAVVSIAGDFEPQAALKLLEQYFGAIPGAKVPPFTTPDPAPQTAERKDSMLDPLAELPAFHIAYHIPTDRTPDHYPLELLASVLGDGESARLYQKLVKDKEILQEIDVNTDGRRGPDLFSFWGICAQGHAPEEARTLIFNELNAVAQKGITAKELDKAKNRMRANFVFGLENNLQRASRLAEFETFYGDASLLLAEIERYSAVTLDDVKRVAGLYFAPTNRTVLDVVPAKAAATQAAAAASRKPAAPAAPATPAAAPVKKEAAQ
ncbi:MAG TPA: pitrilysin family protein [Polyangiales bacterium]|nr:pitrilysin family protein [Polyangiales bacterium]